MISLYDEFETDFNHIGIPLKDTISAKVVEEANGMFELEMEYARDKVKEITEGNIIKCNTHRGKQLFRIYRVIKTLKGLKIYARHITYDLLDNFIEDIRPTKTSGANAIQAILNNTQYKHPFIGSSDIENTATAYYIRKNPIQALIGDEDNSFVNRWGGEIIRDNFSIKMKARGGVDRGYEIRLGKNLIGIEEDIDTTDVVTRLYPTTVINQVVHHLPEKYIDSPLIDKYRNPVVKETRMNLPQEYENSEENQEINMKEIYQMMREHCRNLYEMEKIDQPQVNYKVDFVELSKTEQYKDLKILEQVDLYDTVHVNVSELDINIKAKVIKVEYDVLKNKYEKLELGSFKKKLSDNSNKMKEYVDNEVSTATSTMQKAIDNATEKITGNQGGYRIDRLNAEGKPYETLYMDTDNINTAKNVIRINKNGIGFSNNGINGPFPLAMTIDGKIVADFITTGTLDANLIKAGTLSSRSGNAYIDLDDEVFRFGGTSGDIVEHDNTKSRYYHKDGSYTEISNRGLRRYTASDNFEYNYLVYVGEVEIDVTGDILGDDVVIQLPDEFKGKMFNVFSSLKTFRLPPGYFLANITVDAWRNSISNGTIKVNASMSSRKVETKYGYINGLNGKQIWGLFLDSDLNSWTNQGKVEVQYIVIA